MTITQSPHQLFRDLIAANRSLVKASLQQVNGGDRCRECERRFKQLVGHYEKEKPCYVRLIADALKAWDEFTGKGEPVEVSMQALVPAFRIVSDCGWCGGKDLSILATEKSDDGTYSGPCPTEGCEASLSHRPELVEA